MLVVQVVRGEGVRAPVSVDEQLELPGLSDLELIGVVYHYGIITNKVITPAYAGGFEGSSGFTTMLVLV